MSESSFKTVTGLRDTGVCRIPDCMGHATSCKLAPWLHETPHMTVHARFVIATTLQRFITPAKSTRISACGVPAPCRRRRSSESRTCAADRPVPAGDYLPAHLRDRPLRPALRLLHVRRHARSCPSATCCHAGRTRPALRRLHPARAYGNCSITGGEPLVRRDIMHLFRRLSRHLDTGALEELTMTTNGTQLGRFAPELAALGVQVASTSPSTPSTRTSSAR